MKQREIKFRFWGPKSWTDDDQPIFGMEYDWAFEEYEPINDLFKNPGEQVTIMQFTGLKDKNGKEIYEGDIIRDGHASLAKIYFGENKFAPRSYGWCTEYLHHPYRSYPFDSWQHIEVIGNIYESPELLRQDPQNPGEGVDLQRFKDLEKEHG